MTDAKFTKLLRRAAVAQNKALRLREQAEAEYERRYGKNPSDADDDQWIDSMTGSNGMCNEDITAEDVEKGAVEYANLPPYMANAPSPATAERTHGNE
jgi:hypothetical protein